MSDNDQLLKSRLDDHTKAMSERFEDAFNRTAILKAMDLVALEALRLEIPDWETMKLGTLRAEIKRRQEEEKAKKALK